MSERPSRGDQGRQKREEDRTGEDQLAVTLPARAEVLGDQRGGVAGQPMKKVISMKWSSPGQRRSSVPIKAETGTGDR